jgi:hypothetical protein
MLWQDAVLSFGGFFVAVTMLPMLRLAEKPPLVTSTPLVAMLSAISFTLFTLDLWLAAVGTATQCLLWGSLAVMRWRATRAPRLSPTALPVGPAGLQTPAVMERAA